jgi:hypothetical protein
MPIPTLPEGLVAFVKRDCPTCDLVAPVLASIAGSDAQLTIYTQDDASFPDGIPGVVDDTSLAVSWHHDVETVPTLARIVDGEETERIVGWSRDQWQSFTGLDDLGADLPDMRPGCGSLSVDPNLIDDLEVRFGGSVLRARRVQVAELEDEIEAMFDRGWSDGLPLVPPTEARVLRMLAGTSRAPDEIVAIVPPDLTECTVEKVAVNAVMAGCRPEYLPVVLAAVEAVSTDSFNMHGVLATTMHCGPIVVVNGPIAKAIGMNAAGNVFGQGNRANLTVGRALQLVIRNVGGGRPGEIDRSAQGSPGKLSFCFAELEDDSPWESLATERGVARGSSAVTVFAGQGPSPIVDQLSREPDSLVRSFAECLTATMHPKITMGMDAMLVIGPEHMRVFDQAGWDKARFRAELESLLMLDGADLVRGARGIAEGLPEAFADAQVPKFRPGLPLIVHAGGNAGLFSSILTGWVGGGKGSEPTTVEVRS